jgi:hypothetical protein
LPIGGLLNATLWTSAGVSGIVRPLKFLSNDQESVERIGSHRATAVHPVTPDSAVADYSNENEEPFSMCKT